MKPILITLALWLWAVAATAQIAPTGFGATPTAYDQIDLKWTHNGASVDEFVIERSDGNNRSYKALTTVLQSAKANREYSDKTVSGSSVYYYRIATKLGTRSSATVEANATTPANPTPAFPSGLDVTGKTISSLSVKWNPVAGAEGYETRLSTKSDFTTDLKPGATTKSDFTFSGLAPDRTYFVQVRARNTVSGTDYWSPWSGSVSGRTDQAPSGVQATPKSPTQVEITWTDNSDNEDDFIISRSAAGSGGPWTEAGRVNANVKTFTDNGIQANTTYYYQVCAANKAGQACATANKITTPVLAPAAPAALNVSIKGTTATLTWKDNANNETENEIQRKEDNGPFSDYGKIGAVDGSGAATDTKLSTGKTYCYRVRATNAGGASAYSNEACAATLP